MASFISIVGVLSITSTLVAAAPRPVVQSPSPAPTPTLNADDPSTLDPTTLPTSIKFPSKADNPYPSGIPSMPDGCDGNGPSSDCLKSLASSGLGGYLYYDPKGQCSDSQKAAVDTAIWDATTLAFYSSNFPQAGENTRGPISGQFYMGPDYPQYASRIAGNLKRAWQFKTDKTSTSEYITISCKDTENLCGKPQEGKAVGGYARTDSGWFGYYHYITLCDTFFTVDSMDTKITEIEDDLRSGSKTKAGDMRYLKTTGQFLLHEMMHLRVANGADEPHIVDEYIGVKHGERPGTNDKRAYGPALVHNLAKRPINQDGGAGISSTNADSYAMLANSIWWWDTTSVFPGVPGKAYSATADDATDYPIMLHVDRGNVSTISATTDTLHSQYVADLASYASAAEIAQDVNATTTTTTPSSPPSTPTPIPNQPTPTPAPPPPAADQCGDWYKFFFDSFEIYGKNFDVAKFGADGSGLKKQVGGCGAITDWKFENVTGDPHGYQWHATGRLPIGTKACVGRAVVSAGGASPDGCTGAG